MMMELIETFVVVRYSSLELAGVAAGRSISWTLVIVGLGLLNGMDPIVAQAHGANEPKRVHRCLGVALQFCMIYTTCVLASRPRPMRRCMMQVTPRKASYQYLLAQKFRAQG